MKVKLTEDVNVHINKHITSNIVGILPKGTIIDVNTDISDNDEWLPFIYEGQLCFIQSDYCENVNDILNVLGVPSKFKFGKFGGRVLIVNNNTNIYSERFVTKTNIIGKINMGETVYVKNIMYEGNTDIGTTLMGSIEMENGETGFITMSNCKKL